MFCLDEESPTDLENNECLNFFGGKYFVYGKNLSNTYFGNRAYI